MRSCVLKLAKEVTGTIESRFSDYGTKDGREQDNTTIRRYAYTYTEVINVTLIASYEYYLTNSRLPILPSTNVIIVFAFIIRLLFFFPILLHTSINQKITYPVAGTGASIIYRMNTCARFAFSSRLLQNLCKSKLYRSAAIIANSC